MSPTPPTAQPTATPHLPTVVVAGHICLDIIPTIDTPAIDTPTIDTPAIDTPGHGSALVTPGKLTNVGPAALATGGAVSNTGLALHRLGIPTRLMGKVGDDLFGRAIREIVSRRDPALAAGMIVAPASPSSYTVVISAPGFDRSFLHCPGANDTFCAADVDPVQVADAALFHLGYPPIMRRMFEENGAELRALLHSVQAQGVATSLDTAHVDPESAAGRVDWRSLLARVLPHVDFFLPSLDEVYAMLDPAGFAAVRATLHAALHAAPTLAAAAGIAKIRDLAATVLHMGAAVAAIKLGDQGIYLRTTADPARLARCGKLGLGPAWVGRELLAPAFQVTVVGTTGAGDCAIAGFFAALLRGHDPAAALTAAVAAGACNVEVADAISGIPTWDALQARVAAGWPRLPLAVALPGWHHDPTTGLWHGPADTPTQDTPTQDSHTQDAPTKKAV
jgi:sugar/nucleoside kinase (ribokinase family)